MDVKEITHGTVASPAELIDLDESLNPVGVNWPLTPWAFRGQSQSYGALLPSFQRLFGEKHWVGAAEIIEQDLIMTFRKHYAEVEGRTVDMPDPSFIGAGYDLRCLSVMQHYGVPTRLLDWTSHFWTAVYFACAGDPSKDAELWLYDRNIFVAQTSAQRDLASLLAPTGPNLPMPVQEPVILTKRETDLILELDPRITPRMVKQVAHHTLSSDIFADHVPLLFDLAQRSQTGTNVPDARFRRVLIAAGCKEKTLRFLAEKKYVTAGTIFPDVEGLGRFLHWHLESLLTTLL